MTEEKPTKKRTWQRREYGEVSAQDKLEVPVRQEDEPLPTELKTDGFVVTEDGLMVSEAVEDVYLYDDWVDQRFQRESVEEVSHNNRTGVIRPDWTVDRGEPIVNKRNLQIHEGDMIYEEIDLDLDQRVVWEWNDVVHTSEDEGSGAGWTSLGLFSETTTTHDETDWTGFAFNHSYHIGVVSERIRFFTNDSESTSTHVFDYTREASPYDIRVIRDPGGEWTVFVNGEHIGSVIEDTYTDANYIYIGARDDSRLDNLRVGSMEVR